MKEFSPFSLSSKLKDSAGNFGDTGHNKVCFDNKILAVVNENGQIYYCNEKCNRELNVFEGDNFSKLNSEPDLRSLLNNVGNSSYNNFVFELFLDYNGESKTYNVELEKVLLENEKYNILLFNSTDENKKIETKISNLHSALEYGQVPVIMTDESGKVYYATKSFEKLLELDLDVIYNNHISSVLSWHLSNFELAELQAAIIKKQSWSTNIFISKSSEDQIVIDLKLKPVQNEDGNNFSFLLTAHDVSYYYHKNRLIKKSEEKLRSIINSISDLLLIFRGNENGFYFEDANEGFKVLLELDGNQLANKNIKNILPPKFYDKLETSCSLIKQNALRNIEFDCKNFIEKDYAAKLSYMIDDSTKDFIYILSLRDMTDRMKNEEQMKAAFKKEQQMNRLKTTFLQNMSHELRTPATAVLGYSEIIADCIANNDYEAVQEITKSLDNVVGRLINLFTKIIEISEIEAEEVEINRVRLNCNKILRSVYEENIAKAHEKNLQLSLQLMDTQDLVEIDWYKLDRALNYILDNAIKFSDYGNISIKSAKSGNNIILSVSDNGRGMNQKVIDWLLEPFVQEDEDGLKREYEGAGLGLTIAYKYTKLMGGDFRIESEKNVGTTISMIFPIANPKKGF